MGPWAKWALGPVGPWARAWAGTRARAWAGTRAQVGPWASGPGPKLPRASPNPDPALCPRGKAARGQDPNPGWILPMSGLIFFDTFSQPPQ